MSSENWVNQMESKHYLGRFLNKPFGELQAKVKPFMGSN